MMPRLAVTPGEPAGIGPDILIQVVQQARNYSLTAFADPDLLLERARLLNLPLTLHTRQQGKPVTAPGELMIEPVNCAAEVQAGILDPLNSGYVLECLKQAVRDCQDNQLDALVTGPVHKGIINEAGIPFTGHTEFLATETATPQVVMMLASQKMRVALVTTHLPLCKVAEAITADLLEKVLRILANELRNKFAITQPRILVCGLNPHAGEGGHLGDEEIRIIEPVLNKLVSEGLNLTGPLPADTLFTQQNLQHCDAVLAMYHDQGLPVLKHSSFGEAINITLGLPIIRTSVDHGTALELAGTGKANPGSMFTALNLAAEMASHKVGR